MKITAIADTHGYHKRVSLPGGDLLIAAGDITDYGEAPEVGYFCQWLSMQPYTKKIFIAGNHDFLFEKDPELAKTIVDTYDIEYLQDSSTVFDGLKIYGAPWTPFFFSWAFNLYDPDLREVWRKIPNKVDILVTHGPPAGILDTSIRDVKIGCTHLCRRVMEVNPKLHIFGHNHSGYGTRFIESTMFINASICTYAYKPVHEPITVEI